MNTLCEHLSGHKTTSIQERPALTDNTNRSHNSFRARARTIKQKGPLVLLIIFLAPALSACGDVPVVTLDSSTPTATVGEVAHFFDHR